MAKRIGSIQVYADYLDATSSKLDRIYKLFDAIRANKLRFDETLTKLEAWKDLLFQFCNYPNVTHDDVVDSIAQLWEYVQQIQTVEATMLYTRNSKEVAMFGSEFDGDIAIVPHSPNSRRGYSDMVKIRRPDTIQQPLEYADPFYARAFSVNKYDTPL